MGDEKLFRTTDSQTGKLDKTFELFFVQGPASSEYLTCRDVIGVQPVQQDDAVGSQRMIPEYCSDGAIAGAERTKENPGGFNLNPFFLGKGCYNRLHQLRKGGFLLESSLAKIVQNNILNNGGWEIKAISENGQVQAVKNWWGTDDPIKNEIIGPVAVKPVLEKPIEFNIIE